MHAHLVFDLFAWAIGIGAGILAQQFRQIADAPFSKVRLSVTYYAIAALGTIWGAFFFGTLNLYFSGEELRLGRSVVGAMFGGILGVEIYKLATGVSGSTGGGFVAALSVGIAVGRVGCFVSGLDDFTYGTVTTLPWGVDLGDGVLRHPVQLYEAFVIGSFAFIFFTGLKRQHNWALNLGFYWFVLIYAGQRFLWELLKPYPTLLGPFNIFHLVTAALFIYGIFMLLRRGTRDGNN